jgi:hypothetical protein
MTEWRDRWAANILDTRPMTEEDRRITVDAINGMYEAVNLPRPKSIVFVPSPYALRFGGGFGAGLHYVESQYKDLARTMIPAAREQAKKSYIGQVVAAAMPGAPAVSVIDPPTEPFPIPRGKSVVQDHSWYLADFASASQWSKTVGGAEAEFFWRCAQEAWRMWQGGNQSGSLEAHISFFKEVAEVDIPGYDKYKHWENAALHSGPRIVHEEFCLVSDKPLYLHMDDRERPHNPSGPFAEWSDGTKAYAVHGTWVPWWIIERPELISVQTIAGEQNQEIRRLMVSMFGEGRYMEESKAKLLHKDSWGELYEKPRGRGENPMRMVKVRNSTDNLDGSPKYDWLRVQAERRPMLLNGELGPPQKATALNAVASTFGMTGDVYAAIEPRQS